MSPNPVLRFGLQIARFDYPGVPAGAVFDHVKQIARTAERAGFDSLWVQDHVQQVFIPGLGSSPDEPVLEPYTLLGALAAVTETVRLGCTVSAVTFRNPALLAKTVTTLDVVSAGRAILGLGAAWLEEEHRAYGWDFPGAGERLDRLEEAIRICRAMFAERQSSFDGVNYRVRDAFNVPAPVTPGGPPLLIGGSGERRTLRLVAQYADACNLFGDVATVRQKLDVLERHCAEVGRDPAEITKTKMACLIVEPSAAEARRRYEEMRGQMGDYAAMIDGVVIAGDPDGLAEQVDRYLSAGLDGLVCFLPDTHNLESVELAGQTLSKNFG